MCTSLMPDFALQALLCTEGIGKQRASRFDVSSYGTVKCFLFAIRDNFGTNLPATLQNSHDHEFVVGIAALSGDAASLYILVHVPSLAADEGFVCLYFARAFRSESFILHR